MKVTEDKIESVVLDVEYVRSKIHPTLTLCILSLRNGFCVVGQSACCDPKEFDEAIGRDVAYSDARSKIWQLEGYLLSQAMYIDKQFEKK